MGRVLTIKSITEFNTFLRLWNALTQQHRNQLERDVICEGGFLYGYFSDNLDSVFAWLGSTELTKQLFIPMAGKPWTEGGDYSVRRAIVICCLKMKINELKKNTTHGI